jgi:L-lactate dehydrogenase complex protein LldE
MVRHHYADLFAGDAALLAKAAELASRTYEFSDFLVNVLHAESTGARFPHTATFHDSCHALRELGIKDGPRRLLAGVDGLELREMEPREECCGFGGTFAVKFPELSGAIGMTKIEAIRRTGAEYVIGLDSSCLMQIDGLLRRHRIPVKTAHLAEVLAAR